jgi:DnaK suppressor protein
LNGKSKKREPEFEIYKPMKLRKSKLKPAELEEFRELLIIKRRELMGDMVGLQNEIQSSQNSGGGGGSSSMPMHMADLGTDTWEQELALGLIENERNVIREIDQALGRIADGTYGICIATNKVISKTRLRAKPWAKYCIEYARRRELGLV